MTSERHEIGIGLVAHDRMKQDLADWLRQRADALLAWRVYATGTTASVLKACGTAVRIEALRSGPLGGDQQLGSLIAEGHLKALIFFADPMTPMPHDVDIRALLRLSTLYDIPLAVNRATADLLISNPDFAAYCAKPARGPGTMPAT